MERHKEDLKFVIEVFKKAPRIGSDEDTPEGTRYIQISDTLSKQMIEKLNYLARSLYCEDF